MRLLHSLLLLLLAVTSTVAFEKGPVQGTEFELSEASTIYLYDLYSYVTVLQEPRADGKWRNLWRVEQDGNVSMPSVWLKSDNTFHFQINNQHCDTNYELRVGDEYVVRGHREAAYVEFTILSANWAKRDGCKIYDFAIPSQNQATLVVKHPEEPSVATIHSVSSYYETWTEEDFMVWNGYWELVASGSGSSSGISFFGAKGVQFTDGSGRAVTNRFRSTTSSSISQRTKHTVQRASGLFAKAVEAGRKYENEKYTFDTSSTTSSSLAKTVVHSITQYQETAGTRECGGGAQYVYQYVMKKPHANIYTTHFLCRSSVIEPSCPPLHCKDEFCDTCIMGTFEDPEIDRIASQSPTQANVAIALGASAAIVASVLLLVVFYKPRSKKADPKPDSEEPAAEDPPALPQRPESIAITSL